MGHQLRRLEGWDLEWSWGSFTHRSGSWWHMIGWDFIWAISQQLHVAFPCASPGRESLSFCKGWQLGSKNKHPKWTRWKLYNILWPKCHFSVITGGGNIYPPSLDGRSLWVSVGLRVVGWELWQSLLGSTFCHIFIPLLICNDCCRSASQHLLLGL